MADDQNQNSAQQKILQFQNAEFSAETQASLNQPTAHPEGLDPKDQEFLGMVMEKIDKGEIDLYRPATLLNLAVYEKLSEEGKGKADFDAVNLLTSIREVRKLWVMEHTGSYQIENMIHRIRMTKERLEDLGGDIYII